MIKVNLLPDLVLNRQKQSRTKQLITTGLVVWLVIWGGLAVFSAMYLGVQKTRLSSAKNTHATLDASVNSADNVKFRAQALAVQNSLNALDQLLNKQVKTSVIYARVSALLPSSVHLRSIAVDASKKVTMQLSASSYDQAASTVASFKDSKPDSGTSIASASTQVYFTDVVFSGATLSGNRVDFSISAQGVYPSGATQ